MTRQPFVDSLQMATAPRPNLEAALAVVVATCWRPCRVKAS
ncbi:hypothetical protein [Streptomyces sp. NPDC046909]